MNDRHSPATPCDAGVHVLCCGECACACACHDGD